MHEVNIRKPAVAYLRRSTDKQDQSLGDQCLEVVRYAEEHGYQIIREYVDDAISGTSADERPDFQRMIADAQRGEFRAVIVWHSDRFSRGVMCETEHYRYLLQQATVTVLSVTEDYLARDGIDGDVLRAVTQSQNRQFSISLSRNTLRGQLSSIKAESDPGRAAPYGYDREVLAPDGAVLFRIRFCPGGVREVYDKDNKLQARYERGQSLSKPGRECKARLVLSDSERVHVIKDIFRMCLDGLGFASIAATMNERGIPGPSHHIWGSTTIKAILENPTYRGDLVWNRRTEAKFYRVLNGRTEKRQRQPGEAKVVKTPKADWIVIPNAVPRIVSTADWDKAQVMVARRRRARGGAGHSNRRWLLTGVLECGDCGHKFWGDPRRKGRIEGRATVITNYYTCAGRRSHGKTICPTASALRAEQLEAWVLGKLQEIVLLDEEAVDMAIERFVASVDRQDPCTGDADRIAREIKKIDDTVTALTTQIDPENMPLLNQRLTQLRLRRESLEQELRSARQSNNRLDAGALRHWARAQLAGLEAAMNGLRNDETRNVIATYVDHITVWPSKKCGEMALNPAGYALWRRGWDKRSQSAPEPSARAFAKRHNRPKRRSWVNKLGATGFEPATSCSQSRRATGLRHAPDNVRITHLHAFASSGQAMVELVRKPSGRPKPAKEHARIHRRLGGVRSLMWSPLGNRETTSSIARA